MKNLKRLMILKPLALSILLPLGNIVASVGHADQTVATSSCKGYLTHLSLNDYAKKLKSIADKDYDSGNPYEALVQEIITLYSSESNKAEFAKMAMMLIETSTPVLLDYDERVNGRWESNQDKWAILMIGSKLHQAVLKKNLKEKHIEMIQLAFKKSIHDAGKRGILAHYGIHEFKKDFERWSWGASEEDQLEEAKEGLRDPLSTRSVEEYSKKLDDIADGANAPTEYAALARKAIAEYSADGVKRSAFTELALMLINESQDVSASDSSVFRNTLTYFGDELHEAAWKMKLKPKQVKRIRSAMKKVVERQEHDAYIFKLRASEWTWGKVNEVDWKD